MPTVMRPTDHHITTLRTPIQKVSIGLGVFSILIGVAGVISPGLLGMHLGLAHNMIHFLVGALAFWAGYSEEPKKAYNFSISFGVFFFLVGVFGFIIGTPGYPGIGRMEADQSLFRVIPNVLEFGTVDHFVHMVFGVFLLVNAFVWKKDSYEAGKGNITTRGQNERSDFARKDPEVQRQNDIRRDDIRRDIETKI